MSRNFALDGRRREERRIPRAGFKEGGEVIRMTVGSAAPFRKVPQDGEKKWVLGREVGRFRNAAAAAKRSSITIRGTGSQRASLARATKIPGISAP